MIPTFQEWLKLLELGTAGDLGVETPIPGALGDPQHTQDEDSMNLSTLIQRRLEMLLDEIQRKRGMSRDQLVQILGQVMNVLAEKGMKRSQMTQTVGQSTPPGQQLAQLPAQGAPVQPPQQ